MLYELSTHCRKKKECEYYIPDLPHNLDTDVKDPITFYEVLISAEALYFYQVSDTPLCTLLPDRTRISLECRKGARPLDPYTRTHVRCTASHQNKDTLLPPFLPAAVTPFPNNTRHDLRTSTGASGKPLNSPRRLCLRS